MHADQNDISIPASDERPNDGRSNKGYEKHDIEIEDMEQVVKQANTNINDFFILSENIYKL